MGRSVAGLMALGLNHRTAPVAVRERVALDADGVLKHLKILCNEGICEEALLLSTCNRVELFAVPDAGGAGRVKDYLSSLRGPEGRSVAPHLFHLSGRDAVVHLFRVAASLDSMVLGEPQILGQVKEAIRLAEESSSLGGLLRPLTEQTIRIAKRVRTETELGRHRVGIGSTGVELARQIFGGLSGRRAMLVGVGDMGVEVARALQRAGVDELLVANRTFSRALEVAQEYLGTPISIDRVVG